MFEYNYVTNFPVERGDGLRGGYGAQNEYIPSAVYCEVSDASATYAEGNKIAAPPVRSVGADISYSNIDNAFTVYSTGTYVFIWSLNAVAASPSSGAANDIVVTLESIDASVVYARSGTRACACDTSPVQVCGSAVMRLGAGETLALVNRSGKSITTAAAKGSADSVLSLSVFRVS